MARLVQKSGYIKSGNTAGYMKYIAKREGVEILKGTAPTTAAQKNLIEQILKDFPDAKELFEYEDYLQSPTVESASEFISMALDTNMHDMQPRETYMQYISTRPGAELRGEHGLFGEDDSVNLSSALNKLEEHEGYVWTIIYSLRRADAARLGYDNAESWRQLIMKNRAKLADAMRIKNEDFCWYGAYHDAGHHPHIHLMVWSNGSHKGYLTKDGIAKMRSALTNEIFEDELHSLYVQKDLAYKDLTSTAHDTIRDMLSKMENSICDNPAIAEKMTALASALASTTGKKKYGYLPKPIKQLVDSIVDELAKDESVSNCYDAWSKLQEQVSGYYKTQNIERVPLAERKEFRVIKNMVIAEAENIRIGTLTFEDSTMNDDPDEEEPTHEEHSIYEQAARYRAAKECLHSTDSTAEQRKAALSSLEELWNEGFTVAAHMLGKAYRDGEVVRRDISKAKEWFLKSANSGNDYSMYALGKMLLDSDPERAILWLERAAERNNQFANYKLGKMYLTGNRKYKDIEKALEHLKAAALCGNQYAQYTLGKLYLQGQDVPQDKEQARLWLGQSAAQGNEYAQFLFDHMNDVHGPSALISATRLMHHMSRIFRNQSIPPGNPNGPRIDSKRRRKLMEKRLALGHKYDDHEDQINYQQTMGGG